MRMVPSPDAVVGPGGGEHGVVGHLLVVLGADDLQGEAQVRAFALASACDMLSSDGALV